MDTNTDGLPMREILALDSALQRTRGALVDNLAKNVNSSVTKILSFLISIHIFLYNFTRVVEMWTVNGVFTEYMFH